MRNTFGRNVVTEAPKKMPRNAKRAIRGGIFGNYVDQFDIFLPIIALAPAAAHLYGTENMARNAGLIFIATLIGRPLGAAIFGPIADQIGRIAATKITILGVAITTLLIALVPGSLGNATLFFHPLFTLPRWILYRWRIHLRCTAGDGMDSSASSRPCQWSDHVDVTLGQCFYRRAGLYVA